MVPKIASETAAEILLSVSLITESSHPLAMQFCMN